MMTAAQMPSGLLQAQPPFRSKLRDGCPDDSKRNSVLSAERIRELLIAPGFLSADSVINVDCEKRESHLRSEPSQYMEQADGVTASGETQDEPVSGDDHIFFSYYISDFFEHIVFFPVCTGSVAPARKKA